MPKKNKRKKQVFEGGFKDIKNSGVKGSDHSHACWTDYRNKKEQKKFPFDLKLFARYCIKHGRDFQAITDIMASRPEELEFIEKRYDALLNTADAKDDTYELQRGKIESTVFFKDDSKLIIPRTQEILTNKNYQHILAIGVEENIKGGMSALKTLEEIKDLGGYAIFNHLGMCDAWDIDEVRDFYEKKLALATEWNGGLTFPAICGYFPIKFFIKTPNKRSNKIVISLEKESGIPCIANDDSRCAEDIKRGAFTSYWAWEEGRSFIENIVNSINSKNFERHENYSLFSSPLKHVKYGKESQSIFGKKGLPSA